jgi:hypothetical protein
VLADRAGGLSAGVGPDLECAETVRTGEGGQAIPGAQHVALHFAAGGGRFGWDHWWTTKATEVCRRNSGRAKRTKRNPIAVAPEPRWGLIPSLL